MKKNLLWMTRTAIFLALLISVQFVTKSMSQFVTGSLVNLVLIAAALTAGLASGLTVAVLSPLLATLAGIGPAFPQISLGVMLGNAVIVTLLWLFVEKLANGKNSGSAIALWGAGVVTGALAKFLTLWLVVVKLILPLLTTIKPKQVEVLSTAFSWPQLVTALIGGTLAVIVVPAIRKAVKR